MLGVFIPLTLLLTEAWVSIPSSLRRRFNWAVKLLKGKMRNYPVFHGRQWAGLPEPRWPTLTLPPPQEVGENWKPWDQEAGVPAPAASTRSSPAAWRPADSLEMQMKTSSSSKSAQLFPGPA